MAATSCSVEKKKGERVAMEIYIKGDINCFTGCILFIMKYGIQQDDGDKQGKKLLRACAIPHPDQIGFFVWLLFCS